jgi:hypothetical protein
MATTDAEAIGLPFEEAIDFFRGKAKVPTSHWTDVWRTAHSHSFMVAGAATDALLGDFQDALKKALEHGTTLAEFRGDFDAIVARHGWSYNGTPGWRSRIIYETNMSTAYSAGRYAQMTEPETLAAFPYWQYVHSGSNHPRLQHLGWNGLTLRADDPFWESHYPPNGWRCGCSVRPVSPGGLRRMGKSGPDVAPPIQTRPWRNPKTGAVHQVPVGIDPGFDYNPGMAWQEGAKALPVKAPDLRPVKPKAPPVLQAEDDRLTEAYRPWAETASPDEAAALADYKARGARPINAVLRGERDLPSLRHQAELLQGFLDRAEAPSDLRLLRSIGPGELVALHQVGEGGVFEQAGFTSTTISAEAADAYAKGGPVITLRVRRGQRGVAYVHPFPAIRYWQYEVLMRAGSRYRIVSMADGKIVLELVERHG